MGGVKPKSKKKTKEKESTPKTEMSKRVKKKRRIRIRRKEMRVLVVGLDGVGKTSILTRYALHTIIKFPNTRVCTNYICIIILYLHRDDKRPAVLTNSVMCLSRQWARSWIYMVSLVCTCARDNLMLSLPMPCARLITTNYAGNYIKL